MSLYPLIIGEGIEVNGVKVNSREAIQRQIEFADAHRYNNATLQNMARGIGTQVSQIAGHHVLIPMCYEVSLSTEEQQWGWTRHMSVALRGGMPRRGPTPAAMEELIAAYGFPVWEKCIPFFDTAPDGRLIVHMVANLTDCTPHPRDAETMRVMSITRRA